MRSPGFWGAVCLVAASVLTAPTSGEPILYTFDVTSGSVELGGIGFGSTTSGLAGTFALTLYQSNGHIGESDTFLLEDCLLINSGHLALDIGGIATAHCDPGSLRLLDFLPEGPEHIGPGGVAVADTDVFYEMTLTIEGVFSEGFTTAGSFGRLMPLDMTFTTSVTASDVVIAILSGDLGWQIGIPEIEMTITLDIIVSIEGTAHVAPDPALGGLTALGLAGAGTWLRRRRSPRRG